MDLKNGMNMMRMVIKFIIKIKKDMKNGMNMNTMTKERRNKNEKDY